MPVIPTVKLARDLVGKTVIVSGNGTSILDSVWDDRLRGKTVFVANGGYKRFPDAESLMCSDRHWLAANPDLSGFRGRCIMVTRPDAVKRVDPRMVHLRRQFIESVRGSYFADTGVLTEGHNSTTTNISAAVLRGASRIVLIGIDLTPGAGGRRHSYDNLVDDPLLAKRRYARQVHHIGMQAVQVLARGVEVINASPPSPLDCYGRKEWDAIEW